MLNGRRVAVQLTATAACPPYVRRPHGTHTGDDDRHQRIPTLTLIDVQAQPPTVALSLSRVGVTGVEKVIRLRQNGAEQLFSARFECVVDLGPNQKGAHMSRFEEVVNEAIGEVVLGETTFKAETLAEHIAQLVRDAPGRAPRRGDASRPASPSTSRRPCRASRRRSCTRCTARRSAPSSARAG